jgi:cysteine desulfurase/selenocysteine lyase
MSAQAQLTRHHEVNWTELRAQFPATARFAYLDIGRKALLPRVVQQSAESWLADVYENVGKRAFSMEGQEETRDAVAATFGAPRENIALVKNTSEGINIVAAGFPWREGDNVVISSLEHENNTFPWRYLTRKGIEIRWAEPDEQGRVTVESYERAIDVRTRIIAVAYVAYGNGYRADLPTISRFCKERNIRLVVDAIQGIGVLSAPISSLGADVLCAGGHKAQFSLTGAGFMYITDEMISELDPPYAAKFSFTSIDRTVPDLELAPDAHRYEYGNPNFLGLWVQKRSAEFIASIGLENIEARVQELTTRLIEEIETRQFRVLTPRPWEERAGLVAVSVDGDADKIEAAMRADGVVAAAKDGNIRAGVHFYNNDQDIDRFVESLAGHAR